MIGGDYIHSLNRNRLESNARISQTVSIEGVVMNGKSEGHERVVVDQFTRQADQFRKFAEMPGQPREMVLAATEIDAGDTVLDVACGPGVTTCDLAEVAGHATGIDVTPAMIEQAKELQRNKNLTNVAWHVDSVPPLPFDDEAFSLVFTRYSFHHFPDPRAVLNEMARVCKVAGLSVQSASSTLRRSSRSSRNALSIASEFP